jgi:hypothetical protein
VRAPAHYWWRRCIGRYAVAFPCMAEDHAFCIARQAGWRPDGTDGGQTLGVRDWPDVREGTTSLAPAPN